MTGQASGKHKGRKLRNFLLDKKLQLGFTLFIVSVAAALTAVLIAVIVYETNQATKTFSRQRRDATATFSRLRSESTQLFVKQRQKATQMFKKQVKVATDMLDVMKHDPDLKEVVEQTKKEIEKRDLQAVNMRKRQDEEMRKRRESEDQQLQHQREKEDKELASKQQRTQHILIASMVGFSFIFLVVVFLYGIVLTHKVAGPLFKISRYMEKIIEGKLDPLWGLRKGDQLVDFFNLFHEMYDTIKERTGKDADLLERVAKALESGGDKDLLADVTKALEEKNRALAEDKDKASS